MKVYLSVCSPSCANFALRKTAEDNESKYPTGVTEAVFSNFYVHDCLASRENEEEAISLISQLSELLQKGGFNITKWVSNSDRVLQAIPEADIKPRSPTPCIFLRTTRTHELLVYCDQQKQILFILTCLILRKLASTDGNCFIVNSIYDPLGFLAPIILHMAQMVGALSQPGP